MELGRKEIERLLPHRFPMLLVDQIVDLVPGTTWSGSSAWARTNGS